MSEEKTQGLYIIFISVHGLIRSENMELGRDADTGGQIKYAVELAKALSEHEDIRRVDLLTRLVDDPKVDDDYKQAVEKISSKGYIVRLPCGPRRYLRKEVLWPYLDSFTDHAVQHIRKIGLVPDIIHGHYADAGYIAARLSGQLNIPMFQTGHSLGRVKLQRLLDQGMKRETVEKQYNIRKRIEAEEITLDSAVRVIASTQQEVEEQYGIYDNYVPRRIVVIPPGVDLKRFYPPTRSWTSTSVEKKIDRFLKHPKKPIILALSRPDPRKNISTLIHAFGQNTELREKANLVIVAGNREDISATDKGSRDVLTEMLMLIDRYDLYGEIAYPKSLEPDEIPELFRLAAKRRGVFVNPALTEPFGLTLIEAAASGLPLVATEDGGPRDIIKYCKNGLLIDPLNADLMSQALLGSFLDKNRWNRWAKSGINGSRRHFTWDAHIQKYLKEVKKVISKTKKRKQPTKQKWNRLLTSDRVLICDIDNTLLGDREALKVLIDKLKQVDNKVSFGVATGRRLDSAIKVLKEWKVPEPDIYITSVGSEIHYGSRIVQDLGWEKHINYRWNADEIRKVIKELPGIVPQADIDQREHKISYYIDPKIAPRKREIKSFLRQKHLYVNVITSHGEFLDILPIRTSKGLAVRYFASKWGITFERILVAGDSGNDEEMLRGNTLAVVVGNYSDELEKLRGDPHVYFATGSYSYGILEGIDHYNFFGRIQMPNDEN